MKNIGDYIYESQVFEAEEMPEKYKDQLVNLVRMIVNNYEDEADGDWNEGDLKDYIKKTVEGIEGEALDVLTQACIETAKKLDEVSDGFDSDEDDDTNESLDDSAGLITEDFLDDIEQMAKDAGVDTKKVKKGLNNLQKDAERTWRKATDQETVGDKIHDFGKKVDNSAGRKLRTATGNATAGDKVRNFGEKIDNTVGRKIRTATGNDTAEDKVRNAVDKSKKIQDTIGRKVRTITGNETTKDKVQNAAEEVGDKAKDAIENIGKLSKSTRKKLEDLKKKGYDVTVSDDGSYSYSNGGPITVGLPEKSPLHELTHSQGGKVLLAVAATAAIAIAAHRHIKKKRNEKMLAGLKDRAENASDPKTRKEYKEFYNAMLGSLCKDNGKMRTSPKMSKIPKEYRDDFKDMYKSAYNDKDLRKEGRKYIKDNGSDFIQYDRSRGESTPKEQVAKAKDGSEIHARRKKSGHDMTYVRMKGGKEIGYATKSEFRAARKNEGMVSLKDALLESFEI